MSRLAIVGCEASGKTVFLSALTDRYKASLVPENPAANRFARFAVRQLRSLRQWPPATNPGKTTELAFTLRADGGKKLASFALLEFGGETFRAAFRDDDEAPAHKQAVKALMDYLVDADFVAVLVSLKELLRDPGESELEDFERDTESLWVTRGLLDFIHARLPGAGVVIGLTQADLHRDLFARTTPEELFAERWPSVRAAHPGIPVVAVASVSATDGEGRPAPDFTTNGILAVMNEFAKQQYGDPAQLLADLNAEKAALEKLNPNDTPSFVANKLRNFSKKIDALATADALAGNRHTREIATFRETLAAVRASSKAVLPKPNEKKPRKKKGTQNRSSHLLRFFLAFFLLLAAAATSLYLYNPGKAVNLWKRYVTDPLRRLDSRYLTVGKNEAKSREIIRVITNEVTVTRQVPVTNEVTVTREVVVTNTVTYTADATAAAAPVPAVSPSAAPVAGFRTWHDHKGTPIEAEWTATSEDRKSITLRTRNGRPIRAVLHKLSEEDRDFVKKTLSK